MRSDRVMHRPDAEQLAKALIGGLQVKSSLDEILQVHDLQFKHELDGLRQQILAQQKRLKTVLWVGVGVTMFGFAGIIAYLHTLILKG